MFRSSMAAPLDSLGKAGETWDGNLVPDGTFPTTEKAADGSKQEKGPPGAGQFAHGQTLRNNQ
jgi:hypothetical protein